MAASAACLLQCMSLQGTELSTEATDLASKGSIMREVVPAPNANRKRGAQAHFAAFYAIEKELRGSSPEERRFVRQQKSRPLADAFEAWLRAKQALIKFKLAEAIRCALPAGRASRATTTTVASNSTTIPLNEAARMRCRKVFCTSLPLQAWPGSNVRSSCAGRSGC